MIPSNWKRRRDRLAGGSPTAGDDLADDLFDVMAAMLTESMLEPEYRAEALWNASVTIDAIRVQYLRGEMTAQFATIWRDAGLELLRMYRANRRAS